MAGVEIYADAGDRGFSFILPSTTPNLGGVVRHPDEGHFGTIVGQGGAGKSILALQIVTRLLKNADKASPSVQSRADCAHAAFYFSLQAHPRELKRQVQQFIWGKERYTSWERPRGSRISGEDQYSNGLYLISVPPPIESLNALTLKIRQTIAGELKLVSGLVAVVIDPIGSVESGEHLRTHLVQLRELADSHRTFVFLLAEKHAFTRHTAIEHYSQSIVHLEHNPEHQQHRRLYVQKARGQSFRSGYHYLELQRPPTQDADSLQAASSLSKGICVFPSVDAQSAQAHERLYQVQQQQSNQRNSRTVAFFSEKRDVDFLQGERIEAGSAVFLMGPPGTFKEHIASDFAAADRDGATIYVSFKAEFEAIRMSMEKEPGRTAQLIDTRQEWKGELEPATYVYDARSPLLTPEEILFNVSTFIAPSETRDGEAGGREAAVTFRRAVIWGLRRLYDFPNFKDGVVRFLEALVTMLKAQQITTLVVDWPDKTSASTVPIVDLCQYIFLTRVCHTAESLVEVRSEDQTALLKELWSDRPRQVALLRAQRTRRGVHHSRGVVFKQRRGEAGTIEQLRVNQVIGDAHDFEHLWLNAGMKWEEDLSLLS